MRLRRTAFFGAAAAIAMFAACGGETRDPGPADPNAIAQAASLTSDDFPDGDWQISERSFEEIYPDPDLDATPFPVPPSFEGCYSFPDPANPPQPPALLLTARGRTFFRGGPQGFTSIFTSTQVFATEAAARESFEVAGAVDTAQAFVNLLSEECEAILAAATAGVDDGSAVLVRRERDPGFAIRGVEVVQVKTTISSSAGLITSVSTTVGFVRGHVVASYNANESEDGRIDHERLVRAFIQHVTDAELQYRASAD